MGPIGIDLFILYLSGLVKIVREALEPIRL